MKAKPPESKPSRSTSPKTTVAGSDRFVFRPIPSDGEEGSPYDWYEMGPRLKRLTTWEPPRWEKSKATNPALAGLPPATRESWRFHTWLDRGYPSLMHAYYVSLEMGRGNLTGGNFLVLSGDTGTGKTHLAAAIAWEWFEDGFWVVFARVDDLLDQLRGGYDDKSYHQKLERLRNCHMLILDDMSTEAVKAWGAEKLDRIVDWRYSARLPLVVTTNAAKCDELLPRVGSRFSDTSCSRVVQIDAPDARPELAKLLEEKRGQRNIRG